MTFELMDVDLATWRFEICLNCPRWHRARQNHGLGQTPAAINGEVSGLCGSTNQLDAETLGYTSYSCPEVRLCSTGAKSAILHGQECCAVQKWEAHWFRSVSGCRRLTQRSASRLWRSCSIDSSKLGGKKKIKENHQNDWAVHLHHNKHEAVTELLEYCKTRGHERGRGSWPAGEPWRMWVRKSWGAAGTFCWHLLVFRPAAEDRWSHCRERRDPAGALRWRTLQKSRWWAMRTSWSLLLMTILHHLWDMSPKEIEEGTLQEHPGEGELEILRYCYNLLLTCMFSDMLLEMVRDHHEALLEAWAVIRSSTTLQDNTGG